MLVASAAACHQTDYEQFTPLTLTSAPQEVTVAQLVGEYQADAPSARARWDGVRVYFREVVVETLSRDLYPERGSNSFTNGPVTFKIRYNSDLWTVAVGSVLDVVGEVQSMGDFFIIKDCWINIISGEVSYTVGY